MKPTLMIENSHHGTVVGVDEVGRGPLAGPVVAASVILDKSAEGLGIDDSKKLNKQKREALYKVITSNYKYSIGIIDVSTIDKINIFQATMLAMRVSLANLNEDPNIILVDGSHTPLKEKKYIPVVAGDTKSLSIAAASIVAKVTRDRLMTELSLEFPNYKWEKNAGYGTAEHIEAIRKYGVTVHHRQSFLKKININE